jgi:mannose-6-phosphate isomerase
MSGMQTNAPVAIDGVSRHYEWGSLTAIPALIGLPPNGRPVAELWFGDHPSAPSPVSGIATTLEQVIAADPEGMLGRSAVERFGHRLPFLLKILAADKALSIQAHPTLDQAREGFAAEEAAGIPLDAPQRNYRDANHKPELLCALTPFDAMCGFRSRSEVLAILEGRSWCCAHRATRSSTASTWARAARSSCLQALRRPWRGTASCTS